MNKTAVSTKVIRYYRPTRMAQTNTLPDNNGDDLDKSENTSNHVTTNVIGNVLPTSTNVDPRDAYINSPLGTQTQELMLNVNVLDEHTSVETTKVSRNRKPSTKYDPRFWTT